MSPDGTRIFGYSGPRPIPNMIQNITNARNTVQTSGTGAIVPELFVPTALPYLMDQQLSTVINSISNSSQNNFDNQYG